LVIIGLVAIMNPDRWFEGAGVMVVSWPSSFKVLLSILEGV
jgi:hypothetical protein